MTGHPPTDALLLATQKVMDAYRLKVCDATAKALMQLDEEFRTELVLKYGHKKILHTDHTLIEEYYYRGQLFLIGEIDFSNPQQVKIRITCPALGIRGS